MIDRPFDTVESLREAAAKVLREALEGKPVDSAQAVLLAGGRTPQVIYEKVAQAGVKAGASVHVAFSDERMTPVDSVDSNYGRARSLIDALGIPESQVLRVHTELPLTMAADRYHGDLDAFLAKHGIIPVGFLGIGADGHTASLFSVADLDRSAGRWAVATPQRWGFDRVSVTPRLLHQIKRIIFLATGQEKKAIVTRLLHAPELTAAGLAVAGAPWVELWHAVTGEE